MSSKNPSDVPESAIRTPTGNGAQAEGESAAEEPVEPGTESRSAPPALAPAQAAPESEPAPPPLPVKGDGYPVDLEKFQGPLDLLLYQIGEAKLDITDIPIARITEQYLESIQDVDRLDLDRAGEYLLMAATLMRIKAKTLIPRDEDEEDEDDIDPRAELVRRLLEYREFKRIAETLGEREDEWRGVFRRVAAPLPETENGEVGDLGVSLIELFRSFHTILEGLERVGPLEMETEEYSVTEQMDHIRTECSRQEEGVPFTRLFARHRSRSLLITTFLALLELIREREIVAQQVDRFGEIWLKKPTEPVHDS